MALKKSELYSSLWSSCDELRGGMDASQYKDYVLVLLFVKYVSDKYAGVKFAPITIPKGASFADMVALKGKSDIGDQINKKILGPLANANKLSDMPDFDDPTKLGTGKEKVDRLTNLIAIFENPALDFSNNRADGDDILGDAYEYLMRHFATESGKSKGQFYTPAEVSRVMAHLLGIRQAKISNNTTVYDPTCGSGSLLLKVADEAAHDKPIKVTLYGQEKDFPTAGLARMNMVLHDQPGALIQAANTITNPLFKDGDALKTFDYVVANPPFSDKRWSTGLDPEHDPYGRFKHYGVPPPKQGDYAYLLHILASLKPSGKGACILPHGVLFRGNAEAVIRKNLITRGYIKAIIGLPPNLFYGTGIPACIVVIDKEGAAARKGIFMIDASKGFIKDGNKNRLREQDIHKIVDTFSREATIERYSRMVPVTEIADPKNDYNLNLPRYIDSTEPEDLQDIDGHLRGGIPIRDIDALDAYWQVIPSVRAALFKKGDRPGYCQLKVEKHAIKPTIFDHTEFAAFNESIIKRFTKWRKKNTPDLQGIGKATRPKLLIEQLGEDLLEALAGGPLIDPYDVYQHLRDYWASAMGDDVYIVAADGWVKGAQPREIMQIKNKDGKLVWPEAHDYLKGKRRFKSDLVPGSLLMDKYFAKERDAIAALDDALATIEQQLTEMMEENSGEEGLLAEVIEGEGDKQKITATSLKARLKEIGTNPEYADERKALETYSTLMDKQSETKADRKVAQEDLDAKLDAKYPKLTADEIKTLVVDDKWLAALGASVQGELDRVSRTLTGRVRELAERYATPLPTLIEEVETLSSRVNEHLRRMGQAAMRQLLTGRTRLPGFKGKWKLTRLGDHVTYLSHATHARAVLLTEGHVRYLHYGDVHSAGSVWLDPRTTPMPFVPERLAARFDRLESGDLVFVDASEDLTGIGKSVELRGVEGMEVIAGLHTITARFDKSVLADGFKGYLQFMPSFKMQLQRLAAGTKVYASNKSHVSSIEIELPGVDEQVAIAEALNDMAAEIAALEARRDKTRLLKQGMMQELLTGRTRLVKPEGVTC